MQRNDFLENAIVPSMEMGAYEALWSNGIKSFKQLVEKLNSNSEHRLSRLVREPDAKQYFEQAIDFLHKHNIQNFGVVLSGTLDFPKSLQSMEYPLALLYYQGAWDLAFSPGIAVVGTRKASDEGIKRTRQLVRELVNNNYTIFSGLAAGVDTAAHKAAIEFGGKTVAVIGTPLSKYYPQNNTELQKKIAKEHLLISQVPIIFHANNPIEITRMFFPERNKTMSALSLATIIVEAGETSGTLTQANAALKQGRKLFILENNFHNPKLTWPEKLLKKGAIRVKSIKDILSNMPSSIHNVEHN